MTHIFGSVRAFTALINVNLEGEKKKSKPILPELKSLPCLNRGYCGYIRKVLILVDRRLDEKMCCLRSWTGIIRPSFPSLNIPILFFFFCCWRQVCIVKGGRAGWIVFINLLSSYSQKLLLQITYLHSPNCGSWIPWILTLFPTVY